MTEEKKKGPAKKMSIYQKLSEVHESLVYIQKSSRGYKFNYAGECEILATVRPQLRDLGLFLEFEALPLRSLGVSEMQKVQNGVQVREVTPVIETGYRFTWVNIENPEEKISKDIYLTVSSTDPKDIGSRSTYALRYFLYKYFNVPTGEEDLDTFVQKNSSCISRDQIEMVTKKLNGNKDLEGRMLTFLGVKTLEEIKKTQFDGAMKDLDKALKIEGGKK